ncbi:MAG: hypothetical protein CMI52_02325 [Parcubacteria group bacterium]|nr:hypothetical protein [Parcubacteria group bacterium]
MKYLVTGGGGFIGSHLSEELLNRGHEVVIIDNFITGQRHRVPHDAKLVEADIRNYAEIAEYFIGVDGVFHTAAYPRVPRSIAEPMISHDINTNGTQNVLEASAKAGVKRLIFSGSSTPYGNQESLPLHEGMRVQPMCPYAAQKIAGELYCNVYSQLYNLETVCLRYFGVYGKHMLMDDEYAMAVPAFIKARLENKPVTIFGDGTVTRDFTHVRDIVRGNILAMESQKVGRAEIINLGAGKNVSVNDLAGAIGVKANYEEARYEPKDTLADNSKARELLNWQPTITFQEGMKELVNYYIASKEKKYERTDARTKQAA